jgi:broad specificity phosphatase PhoE
MSSITHIVTSTLPRSRQLAELIAKDVAKATLSLPAFITSDLFVEIKKPSEVVYVHRDDPKAVHIGKRTRALFDLDYRYSDEENRWRIALRLWKAVWFLAELDAECVVVVTHGKFLRALWHFLYKGGDFKRFYEEADRVLKHDHTAITILELEPSFRKKTLQWNLKSWNDVSHRELLVSHRLKMELSARP